MKVKEEVQMYGDAFVKKSLSLPLTLKERMAEKLILAKIKVRTGSVYVEAKSAELISKAKKSYASYYAKVTTDNALSAISTMFGEKAGAFTAEKLQLIKKADLPGKVNEKMTSIYKYSKCQVGIFAKKANEMEAKYVGTSFVSKAMGAKKC
jgi:hypothetical protein